ncbi:M43 family zinc metalloprotease [uncultured Imperialibacter sp.]|uniref:M43 family zinc metalloprotease n=1 Tax=uncultured Imperialibacter sp. TaxID=1672639 RepID=UPI0030D74832|tara:strand:+ start:104098 stop:107127 length:3030 start_codon:yes stop_codon:yes gene_type:complete
MSRRLYFFLDLAVCIFLCFSHQAFSQEKCGTVQLEEKYRPIIGESVKEFESWVQTKKTERQLRLSSSRTAEAIYTIPVVIHVLHQGEAYGEGSNIPLEQVLSQIELLNQDFRRLNSDTTDTREIFKPVAADALIEFALAKRDPEGMPTSGVVRARAGKDSYAIGEEDLLQKVSYWPPDRYLNIWVTNLKSGLLGFAQFPVSDLIGLKPNIANKFLPDGVTIDYEYFGQGFNAKEFSTGRTATHEIGHYLGLRHIWGDGGCGSDDYCSDTPAADRASSSGSCELSKASCGSTDMIENYMDYSPDKCMNIFTKDQKERMRTVLEFSPRRRSLIGSAALVAPTLVDNDLGIKTIVSPAGGICSARFMPEIVVRNYGTSIITQFEVSVVINGLEWDSRTISTNLAPLAAYTVTFDEVLLEQGGLYTTTFEIGSVNQTLDNKVSNNKVSIDASYQRLISLPMLETFEENGSQLVMKADNPDQPFAAITLAPKVLATNLAIQFDYFSADSTQFGDWEMLLSPIIDLTKYPSLTIDFDYAYGHDGINNSDGLLVAVSTDCGATFEYDDIVFQRFSEDLATTYIEPGQAFIPSGPAEWKKAFIALNNFKGADRIQLAFIGQNGLGNNLFLDDIKISSNNLADYDIGISEVTDLSFISCINQPVPTVEVKNFGKQPITSFLLSYTVNNTTEELEVNNIFINTGQTINVPLEIDALEDGTYKLELALDQPNGNTDQRISDNSFSQLFHVKTATDVIPFRETFTSNRGVEENLLHRITNTDGRTWQIQNDESLSQGNKVARMTSYDLTVLGDEFWLATKVLDLDDADEASMSFKLSYAKRQNRSERLRVMVSVDCGINFRDVVYDKRGSDLAITESEEFWAPSTSEDWKRETIDLSAYAGNSSVVVAIVGTNGNGNNMYLDDIEFYLSGEPTPVFPVEDLIRLFPNPAKEVINVAFSLAERQTVTLRMQDVRGRVYFEKEYPNTLNQIYQLTTVNEANGMYLIQAITKDKVTAQRVIIRH